MPDRPFPASPVRHGPSEAARPPSPDASLAGPPARAASRAALPLLIVVAALLAAAPPLMRALPACDARDVRERLADTLDLVPALAARDARLLDLDEARSRGHAGRASLRACQGRLVTTLGAGALEYSIRRAPGGAIEVRPELFQGGWRTELLPADG